MEAEGRKNIYVLFGWFLTLPKRANVQIGEWKSSCYSRFWHRKFRVWSSCSSSRTFIIRRVHCSFLQFLTVLQPSSCSLPISLLGILLLTGETSSPHPPFLQTFQRFASHCNGNCAGHTLYYICALILGLKFWLDNLLYCFSAAN